jgi:hypothetical protein
VIHLKRERVEWSGDVTNAHNPKVSRVESHIIAKVAGLIDSEHKLKVIGSQQESSSECVPQDNQESQGTLSWRCSGSRGGCRLAFANDAKEFRRVRVARLVRSDACEGRLSATLFPSVVIRQ